MNELEHSPADIIRQLLLDLSIGVSNQNSQWSVFISGEPDLPDEVITVYDTLGIELGRSMVTGDVYQTPGIQIRVRSRDHKTGWLKCDSIRHRLSKEVNWATVTIGGKQYRVHAAVRMGGVLSIGTDSPNTKRRVFTLNFQVSIRPVL
jgi:hypothetical protein